MEQTTELRQWLISLSEQIPVELTKNLLNAGIINGLGGYSSAL